MLGYLVRRTLFALVTGLAVLTLVFGIVRILPGKPSHVILGDFASQAAIEALDKRLGLDRPIAVQYVEFMRKAIVGDWGQSMVTDRPVMAEIMSVLPWTLELTLAALLLGVFVGVPLGVVAALQRNRGADNLIRVVSLMGLSFPAFVSAVVLLLVFAIELRMFPVISAGTRQLQGLGAISGSASHQSRAHQRGLHHARDAFGHAGGAAGGLHPHRPRQGRALGAVVWRHALGNAMLPIVTVVGLYPRHPDRQLGADRDRVQPARARQADRGALSQRDYTHAAGPDGDLHLPGRRREPVTDIAYGLVDPRVQLG